MRIAFAIEHFDPRQGGAEQYAWGLARWLVAGGHELTVFTTRAAPEADSFARVVTLRDPGGSRARRPLRVAAALHEALGGEAFDVVHGFNHMWPCNVLRLGGGVHLAFEACNALSEPNPLLRAFKVWSNRWSAKQRALRENELRQFDDPRRLFIAVSRRVADDMERFHPTCRGRVTVIHNGVDTAKYSPETVSEKRAASRSALGLHDDETVFLFASNNYRLKGLGHLLRALAELRRRDPAQPYRLLVAGRGRSKPYERLARGLGLGDAVQFLGPGPMLERYAAADVLAHPSFYDAFGFVGIEAMACGLSVVCSTNCGVSEIMRDGDGACLFPMPCGTDRLADALARAATPEFRAAARVTNRAIALEHTIEGNYGRVLEVYRRAAESRQL